MRKLLRSLLNRDPRNIQHQIAAIQLITELGDSELELAAFYFRDLGALYLPENIVQSCTKCGHPVQHPIKLTNPHCYFCAVDQILTDHHMEQHKLEPLAS